MSRFYVCNGGSSDGGPAGLIFRVDSGDRLRVAIARRALMEIFDENLIAGWGDMTWKGRTYAVALNQTPDSWLGTSLEDALYSDKPAALPDGFDPESLPDDEVWRAECLGWRVSLYPFEVNLVGIGKYCDTEFQSPDLSSLFEDAVAQ